MKSQKRTANDRAFPRGYQTGVSGKSRSLCPFSSGDPREFWMSGWREGREDLWNGFNGKAQAQKLSSFQPVSLHLSH